MNRKESASGGDSRIPIIDMWAPLVPAREVIEHMATTFPLEQLPYFQVFQHRRVTEEEFVAFAPSLVQTDEAIIGELDAAGITKSLVTGLDERTGCGKTFISNSAIAALVERHPGRFIPFAGADIMAGAGALRALKALVLDDGFRGLSLRPFMIGLPPSHRAYWPFYSACVELDVPVSIHTSTNWTRTRESDLGHPRHLDTVACAFPELRIIASHAGYPWVLEACLLAWKHPNVYLELGAHRPRYFTVEGGGWESLLRFGSTTIADKILYGSGAFLIGRPYMELVTDVRALPLAPKILERWLLRNSARLLGLEGGDEVEVPCSKV